MISDANTVFSGAVGADGTRSGQTINATALSTNVLDLRGQATPALVDEGITGGRQYLVVRVVQPFNNLTSLTITLESDSASSMAGAPVVHLGVTVALASLAAGAVALSVPLPSADHKRFLALRYTVNGPAPTTGSVFAGLTDAPQRSIVYPSAVALDI